MERTVDYRNVLPKLILTGIVVILVLVLVHAVFIEANSSILIPVLAASGLIIIAFVLIRLTFSPDRVRAIQTNRTLKLASKTLDHMRMGLNREASQSVCELLLPETHACGVAIADTQVYVGYAAHDKNMSFMVGHPICTTAAQKVLQEREMLVIDCPALLQTVRKDSGMDIRAAIVVPLVVRDSSVGLLKFYYDSAHLVDDTQLAIAQGLAELLSTQLSLSELDHQAELATRAELKALQSQINPHFLFNTINTIASLIRTNPEQARVLLREFAVFYRQTLQNSETLITLEREMQQTMRYLVFEVARFGEDRIKIHKDIDPDLLHTRVPSFIIQPIIENSINHAMRPCGPLSIVIRVYRDNDDVVISVSDDGIGMEKSVLDSLGDPTPSKGGTGIALKNVKGRLTGFFDSDSEMIVESEVDKGTITTMRLGGAALQRSEEDENA